MSKNPYDVPRQESAAAEPGLPPDQTTLRTRRLHAHASAVGHGYFAYLAIMNWIQIAFRSLGITHWWIWHEVELLIQIQFLAPCLPALLIWAIVFRCSLTGPRSLPVRVIFWSLLVLIVSGTMISVHQMGD
ncbi:MAG TPA: hypothetical protein VGN57_05745 [Pirellulaceae bacterium]|jgi:apolipoprotein N-acyltransferase|nr:hypothetical protein [Pirellulaceae bacterium]